MEHVDKTDTKQWSSIDIYLFSNGQQYSPPRKYHLRSEELQWWGATISYLGRTHYGSGHASIDIYTTDGVKVNGPLELINGAAYVAVEPPDTFVDTGYEEYLLKASRSWDKRLILKSFNPETTDPKLNVSADDTITSVDNASPTVGDNTISSSKNQALKPGQLQRKKPITSPKQIQKKKPSDSHNTTLKRICVETDKIFPCPRKTSLKNEVCNRKRSSLVPSNRNASQHQSICSKKANSAKPDKSQDEYHDLPDTETSNREESLRYPLFSCNDSIDFNPQTRKKLILSDAITDEGQTVVSLYRNKDHDVISVTSNPESEKIVDKPVHQQNSKTNYDLKGLNIDNSAPLQQGVVLKETEAEDKLKEVITKERVDDLTINEVKSVNKYDNEQNAFPVNNIFSTHDKDKESKFKIPLNETENKLENGNTVSNSRLSDKEATDEYVAYMNRGGLLLLKFNIKVKDCKSIFNRNKSNDTEFTSSIINLLKSEKISQVDIDLQFSSELLKGNNGRCIQNKSLQSVINNLHTENVDHIDSKQPRIIIIKCACRDPKYDREHDRDTCRCNDEAERKTLPKQKLKDMFPCCHCYDEIYSTSKDTQNITMDEYSTKNYRSSISKPNGPRVSYLAQKFENADKLSNNGKSSRNESHTPSVVTSRLNDSSVLETTVEHPISENIDSTSKSICDKSIQTDWSNVILEARRHKDENYTFHLPSLYVLKQCKL